MKKAWWQSKTVWAGLIIAAYGVLSALGIELPTELILSVASGLGIIGIRGAIDQK